MKIKTGSFFQRILIKYQDMFYFKNFLKYKLLKTLEQGRLLVWYLNVTPKESMQNGYHACLLPKF